jgi:type I restriction enzyme S subunit
MNSEFMKLVLRATARGAIGQANINTNELRAFPLYVPPLAVQKEFVNRVRAIKELLPTFVNNSDLDDMFSVLLQKAFAGELTAKWRKAHMQELLLEMQQQAKALNLPMPKEMAA